MLSILGFSRLVPLISADCEWCEVRQAESLCVVLSEALHWEDPATQGGIVGDVELS